MRIPCPYCGPRDAREFTVRGAAEALDRPATEGWDDAAHAALHLRANPAGWLDELWYHAPCGSWLVVTRHTVTHEVRGAVPAAARGGRGA